MGVSKASRFAEDRIKFFNNFNHQRKHDLYSIDKVDWDASAKQYNGKGYSYLHEHNSLILQEFNDLYASLEQEKDVNDNTIAFWFYCIYCSHLLENYYVAYGQKGKAADQAKLRAQILARIQPKAEPSSNSDKEGFLSSLRKHIKAGFHDLLTTPVHASKVRDKAGMYNLWRIYWVFCRLMLKTGLILSRDIGLLDKLDELLGSHTEFGGIFDKIDIPPGVLNVLSVGFFAARFMINAAHVVKHTFFPSKGEKETSTWRRFVSELDKRHADLANHGVWGAVNFITNFNSICHISAPAAGWITAGFLVFDILCLLYVRQRAKQEYLQKRADYLHSINALSYKIEALQKRAQKSELEDDEQKDLAFYLKQREILQRQQEQLEIRWKSKSATLNMLALATVLLASGFALSMLVSPPLLVFACYFVCMIGIALYLSEKSYSSYQEKSLALEFAQHRAHTPEEIGKLEKACAAARNEFIFTLAKNIIVPSLLIAAYAVCWPAAVALTVLVIGYELFSAYRRHRQSGKARLEPSISEEEKEGLLIAGKGKEKEEGSDEEEPVLSLVYNGA